MSSRDNEMASIVSDYTLVLGLDRKHLDQLRLVWPTWQKHKPTTLKHPIVIFYDRYEIMPDEIERVVGDVDLTLVDWPPFGVLYSGDNNSKWYHPQRSKMLSGFVHTAASHVKTQYWLKLDTDVVAIGQDDWVPQELSIGLPAIVAHPWSFTKPPDQIQILDRWVYDNRDILPDYIQSYGTVTSQIGEPKEGSSRIGHKRIISWCAFFNTRFTRDIARWAEDISGNGKLPVPSQDGYMWYMAKRLQKDIVRTSMKERGWEHWCTDKNIRRAAERAL